MSKRWAENLSSAERAQLAAQVKTLRQTAGLTKKEVYDEAQISRQTLDNIENGHTVPQIEVLLRVLDVVGFEVDAPEYEEQTEIWLSMIGTLIESIPGQVRPAAVNRAIRSLATDSRRAKSNVTVGQFGVGGRPQTALEDVELDISRLAVSTDDTPIDPERGEK